MSPNKRKIFESDTSDEEDSFKHRRSSLRVNLSRSDNQTDSGNGSLWRTEIENDEGAANAAQTVGRSSRGRGSTADERSRRSDPGHRDHTRAGASNTDNKRAASNDSGTSAQGSKVKEGVQLKRLTINLEDISTKERHLVTSCERLKDAILSKTKQIFDGENELSVKTLKVLRGNKEKRLASGTRNPRRMESETIVLDTTDRPAGGEQPCAAGTASDRRGADSNIVATPMSNDRRGSLERTVDKSRLTQRRLVFVERDKQVQDGQTRSRIIEDVALRRNSPLPPPKQADETSPILSGSNRRLSLFGGRGRLRSQNQYLDNAYSTVHSVRTTSIGMPVVCSTFIDDNATTGERGTDCNDASASRATHTTTRVISMEMTEVQGGVRVSERHVSVRSRMSDASNSTEGESHEEGSMERNKDAVSPRQEDIEYPVSGATANEIPQVRDGRIKGQNKKSCTISLSDSDNTMRSSLKVNTSLDELIETSRAGNVRKPSDYRANNANQDFATAINRKKSIDLNDQRESTNTARTSLQMNTSVDSMRETWRGRSDEDDKERSRSSMKDSSTTGNKETRNEDLDSLENISLIERLRNISVRNPVSHNDKSRFSKMRDEDKRRSSNSGDSYSYVEGTPYPISRLVLFRSQLKHKTQHLDDAATCSSGLNSMGNEESNDKTKSAASHSKVLNERHTSSTETQKTMEASTVTVEDTPNSNPFVTQNQLTVIKDTPDGTRCETDEKNTDVQNTECAPVRKGRRRLLPLHETSQLCSLTPVEERRCTPEEPTSAKQNERPKKRPPKRKTVKNSKRNTNDIKHDTASKPTLSDSDCDMLENRKQEVKKTRRPKKVISKKILVKKFADENVLNLLQENRQDKRDHLTEDRDSLDDFVKCRTILSTQRNKHKSQKIVIVTTGLSKGDKSLVNSIVKSLGAAEVEMNVSRRTTHVVSTGVRTVNLLRGIIRGCWLVTLEWVLKSLENNAWLNPETFEMKHFSKAVQENRKDRQLFGLSYTPELFSACGFIHIEHKTTMPCDTLKELIKTAGGHITENIKLAKIIIGANGLKETWVVDSITTGELQLTKFYQRN